MYRVFDYTRALSLILYGIFTAFFIDGTHFGRIFALHVIYFVPLWCIGVVAVAAGLLILFERTIVVGYFFAMTLVGVLMICSIVSFFTEPGLHSTGIFLWPITLTALAAGAYRSIRKEYGELDY